MTAPLEIRQAELLPADSVLIASRRWDSNGARLCVVPEGKPLDEMVRTALEKAYPGRSDSFYATAMTYCRVRLDGLDVYPIHWGEVRPQAGQRIEMIVAPSGGGGGGKNPLAAVLSLVVMVAAVVFQQYYLLPALQGAAWATAGATGALGLNLLGTTALIAGTTAVGMVGMMAVNALFPVSMPTANINTPELETSQTYSINGGQNSANPNGYVPLVLGTHKMTPPLGAKSWTHFEGDDQYLNMLVVWGHADVVVTDFRIGETPLGDFSGVSHVFHKATTGDDLKYFGRSYNEQSVGSTLNYNEPVVRTVGECDSISIDIAFAALADLKSGTPQSKSVLFRIEYAEVGTDDWKVYSQNTRFFAPAQYCSSYPCGGWWNLYCSSDGVWHASRCDGKSEAEYAATMVSVTDEHWSPAPLVAYKDKHKRHEYWTQDAWYDAGISENITITGSQATPLTRTFEWAVPHGEYQVRITRLTADTDDAAIQDTGVWSVSRAIRNRAAFNTPLPVACSELRIKATEELSGYVSNFNAVVTSFVPDWNGTEWDQNETSNPASLLRYVLLSEHGSYRPFTEAKLDEQSFIDFWNHCNERGYTFNFIADTETLTWKRLTQIAAAGRATVTCDNDGKISVVMDRADKMPVQMFTPRNSWGFSVERAYQKYPHALRAKFRNAEQDYEENNAYVYADGYTEATATNIVEWEAEGKTTWAEVWRFGRYYLAGMRLRPETVTLSTDWEWRMCRRGDLVLVAHDVLTNTFGTARIVALLYSVEGETVRVFDEADIPTDESGTALLPVGVVLDDTVIFSEPSPARYGIAVRQNTGRMLTYEVTPQYGQEAEELYFRYGLTAAQVPSIGALASVALFATDGETEVGQYLVAGITPGENMSADLTLIPYAPEIENADTGVIPAWTAAVRLPGIPKRDNLPVPTVKEVRADESVIIRSGDSLISRIAVWYGLPSSPDASLGEVQVQMQAADDFGNVFSASAPLTDPYIAVQGVEDGRTYKVSLRLVSARGIASAWSTPHVVYVIGKTSTPPEVENLTAAIVDPQGVALTWDAVDVMDFDHYEVSGAAELKTVDNAATVQVFGKTGTLTFAVQSVDTLGLASEKVEASVEVLPPAAPAPVYTVLPQRGAEISWADCKTTWSIDRYEVEDMYEGTSGSYTDPRFGISPRSLDKAYRFNIHAVDIFGNHGPVTTFDVTVQSMDAPAPTAKVDGSQLVISWPAVAAPFALEWYEIETVDGVLVGKVKGTEMRFEAPAAGTHGYRVRGIDIAGNAGPWGECDIVLAAPKAPAVTAALGEDAASIALSWTMPASDVPVVAFDVVRMWEVTREDGVTETREEDYGRFDVQAHNVPPVAVGEHSFLVRAIDNSGNVGPWGSADFTVRAPGAVTPYDCRAVYNNVMLYFTEPASTFFKVREYLVEEVEGEYAAVVGTVDALFFAEVRSSAGTYIYGITPVDMAGNLGPRATVAVKVDSPPNLILLHEWESVFNGERSLLILDGKGSMLGPVPVETWQANLERSAAALGTTADAVTWEAKQKAGLLTWLSPHEGVAVYVETQDVGELIEAPTIDVTATWKALEGSPEMACRIEVSADGDDWRVAAEDATNVTTENVRFVRLTLSWTGGLVQVQGIYVTLNVKFVDASGTVTCRAADCVDENGEFLPEEAFGTRVDFNVPFVDVEDIEAKAISTVTGLNPLVLFPEGAAVNPTGFRVALLDVNGQPVDGDVYWYASGR